MRPLTQAVGSAERAATRLALLACLAALALGAAACGDEEPGVSEPAREGLALPLDGVDYNVFITRQLNPGIPPDDTYVEAPEPAPGETLYGIFLQTCNNSDEARSTVDDFKVVDNQGNEFEPEELPEDNALRVSLARARSQGVHPGGRQRGSARPDGRLDAALQAAASDDREPPARARDAR